MYAKQNGKCAICGRHLDDSKKRSPIDHDHKTGVIRGILCLQCNHGLGYFQDSIENLEMAIIYLKKQGEQNGI